MIQNLSKAIIQSTFTYSCSSSDIVCSWFEDLNRQHIQTDKTHSTTNHLTRYPNCQHDMQSSIHWTNFFAFYELDPGRIISKMKLNNIACRSTNFRIPGRGTLTHVRSVLVLTFCIKNGQPPIFLLSKISMKPPMSFCQDGRHYSSNYVLLDSLSDFISRQNPPFV